MKLLVDMNLSPRLATLLTAEGFDAVHWSSVGPPDADDPQIMSYARLQGFVVLTHDLDFSAILAATNAEKPSVIQVRAADLTPELLAPAIIAAVSQCREALAEGALLTVDTTRMRLRLLPLN